MHAAEFDAFLRARSERLRPTVLAGRTTGRYAGRVVMAAVSGDDVEVWRCSHEHVARGLAFACALEKLEAIRGR